MRSMTGFGARTLECGSFIQQWEVRSVNGRFLDIRWRLPAQARPHEAALDRLARSRAARGRLDISLQLRQSPQAAARASFDLAQATAMLERLEELAALRNERLRLDYGVFLQIPALWQDAAESSQDLGEDLAKGLGLALDDWDAARAGEGAALCADLEDRLEKMRGWLAGFRAAAPRLAAERSQAMCQRVEELLEARGLALDEGRLAQELTLLADRLDVSEELTRLGAHLDRLGQVLQSRGEGGKKLDFTLQECFREINTFGNKLPDAALSAQVVDFKNELEKCREQVQNLE